ncbi:succinylglutamate desuccinylase/aspartoacylase family protein [Haloferax chudinovii]|uniref:Succinylglutamate desuccinylase/aspartoacylase family protein n=1 Tax=Haloferax chudinovii TaxID=1109010 RepID=A0ABD5XHC1_9EURY
MITDAQPVEVGGRLVEPGERRQFRYELSETYNGDAVEVPVSVITGEHDGPTVLVTAAVHGDEMNGVKILQQAASRYDPADLHGTLVCLHVLNVPGFLAQQRYLPFYDEDLNRAFPGNPSGKTSSRFADELFTTFIRECDLGIDFHTSTRHRTTMPHVRADVSDPAVERLARAFGMSVILAGAGSEGTLRTAASAAGIPTITVETGRAHRFQTDLVERALRGIDSVLGEYGVLPGEPVVWPGWTRVVAEPTEKTWIRADRGGLIDVEWGPSPLVEEGDLLFTLSDHFEEEVTEVRAPFTGIVVGVLECPLAYPGHPLCHFVRVDEETADIIRGDIERGVFDVYREGGFQWPEPRWYAKHERESDSERGGRNDERK